MSSSQSRNNNNVTSPYNSTSGKVYTEAQLKSFIVLDDIFDHFVDIVNGFRSAFDVESEEISSRLSDLHLLLSDMDDSPDNRSKKVNIHKEITLLYEKKLDAIENLNRNMQRIENSRNETARMKSEKYKRNQQIKNNRINNMSITPQNTHGNSFSQERQNFSNPRVKQEAMMNNKRRRLSDDEENEQ